MLDVARPRPTRPAPPPPKPPKFRFKLGRRWLVLAIVVIAAAALAAALLLWRPWAKPSDADITARITAKVSRIYLTPTGEQPVVAKIQDRNKLAGQDFYKDARNGDYLLLYNQRMLAIVYREQDNKVIIAAPVASKQ